MINIKKTSGHLVWAGLMVLATASLAAAQDLTQVLLPPIGALKDQEAVKQWQVMAQSLTNALLEQEAFLQQRAKSGVRVAGALVDRVAASEAARDAEFQRSFAPWLHTDGTDAAGNPLSFDVSLAPTNFRALTMRIDPARKIKTADEKESGRTQRLLALAEDLRQKNEQNLVEAEAWAKTNGHPQEMVDPDGRVSRLMGIRGGRPFYYTTLNIHAADTISTDELWTNGSSGLNLNGEGTAIGVWDQSGARATHREFTNGGGRVFNVDVVPQINHHHTTHVVGTLLNAGVDPSAKGMSSLAVARVYSFSNDFAEMTSEAATNRLRISNHSYGSGNIGWFDLRTEVHCNVFDCTTNYFPIWWGEVTINRTNDYQFGNYQEAAQEIDRIGYASQTYLSVWAAGNERGASFGQPAVSPANGYYVISNGMLMKTTGSAPPKDGDGTGYDTLFPEAVAKNSLVVGAVSNIIGGYVGSNSVKISTFSSFGPTDDGRIKPDLVGDGVNVKSSGETSDSNYFTDSGTSFSTPAITGSLNLLIQLQNRFYGTNQPMLASTLRGLVIHTADEAGPTPGPDYKFGWGLMNTKTAAVLMTNNYASQSLANIKEVRLFDGDYIELPVVSTGTNTLKATICWTDPAGPLQPVALNPGVDPDL